MSTWINIFLGFQVGFQVIAAFHVFRIMRMYSTPSIPYGMLLLALLLMGVMRLDNIVHWFSEIMRFGIQMVISILLAVAFAKIYSLIKERTI